jgi:ABC-type phosphate transport system substrate-binding protein
MLSKVAGNIRTHAVISAALCLSATAAYADVVVIVAAKSDVENLTQEQVSQIYLAKKTVMLPGGVEAKPVDQAEGSAIRDEFYTKVLGKSAQQLRAYWSDLLLSGLGKQRPQQVPDSALVKKWVTNHPGQVGYISKDAVDSSVKVVLAP